MAELLTNRNPQELFEMFLLCYENETHYKNLVNVMGLNFLSNLNDINNHYNIEIYLTNNKDRKTYRQKIGCVPLDVFEQDILVDCNNRLRRKYELQNIIRPNFNFKLQNWQIKLYHTLTTNKPTYQRRNISDFCVDSIMMFMQTTKDIHNGMFIDGIQISSGLNNIKNKYDLEDLEGLYVSFELQQKGESTCTIENVYLMYKRATEENIDTLAIKLKNKQFFIGVPVYTPTEIIHIENNNHLDNEEIGNVKILTEMGEVINIMSDQIDSIYPNYQN